MCPWEIDRCCCSLWSCVSCSGPLLPASAGAWPASSHGVLAPFSVALADSLLGLPSLQSSGTALLRTDGKGEREDERTHRLDPGPRECHQLSPAPGPLARSQIYRVCDTKERNCCPQRNPYSGLCYRRDEPRRMQWQGDDRGMAKDRAPPPRIINFTFLRGSVYSLEGEFNGNIEVNQAKSTVNQNES